MDAATVEANLLALDEAVDKIRQADRNEGRQALAVQNLVQVVARHGALSDPQLEACRERREPLGTHLPDAVRIGERLVAFPPGPAREQAVQTFVDTGRVPTPKDTPVAGTGIDGASPALRAPAAWSARRQARPLA